MNFMGLRCMLSYMIELMITHSLKIICTNEIIQYQQP